MANDSFKVKKGLNIEPQTAPNLSTDGDIGFNSTDSNLELYTGGSVKKIVTNSQTQTLTNKTLTAPVISTISNTGTITLPTSTDTLVGRATTDTLTNKTLSSPTLTTPSTDVVTIDGQASTPSNPSAGNYKVYVKDSTGKLTILNSSGTETDVGVGSTTLAVASKTGAYTATTSDDVLLVDATSGAITITLYAASGNSGKTIRIKKTDSSFNNVTIDGNSSETIDGATTIKLNIQDEAVTLLCDGSNWEILEKRTPQKLTSYSPTLNNVTLGSGSTSAFRWRKQADGIFIQGAIELGTGGSFTGIAGVPLPTGLTARTADIDTTGDNDMPYGVGRAYDSSATTTYVLTAEWTNARTNIEFSGNGVNVAGVNATIPFTWAASDSLYFSCWVPITDWEG